MKLKDDKRTREKEIDLEATYTDDESDSDESEDLNCEHDRDYSALNEGKDDILELLKNVKHLDINSKAPVPHRDGKNSHKLRYKPFNTINNSSGGTYIINDQQYQSRNNFSNIPLTLTQDYSPNIIAPEPSLQQSYEDTSRTDVRQNDLSDSFISFNDCQRVPSTNTLLLDDQHLYDDLLENNQDGFLLAGLNDADFEKVFCALEANVDNQQTSTNIDPYTAEQTPSDNQTVGNTYYEEKDSNYVYKNILAVGDLGTPFNWNKNESGNPDAYKPFTLIEDGNHCYQSVGDFRTQMTVKDIDQHIGKSSRPTVGNSSTYLVPDKQDIGTTDPQICYAVPTATVAVNDGTTVHSYREREYSFSTSSSSSSFSTKSSPSYYAGSPEVGNKGLSLAPKTAFSNMTLNIYDSNDDLIPITLNEVIPTTVDKSSKVQLKEMVDKNIDLKREYCVQMGMKNLEDFKRESNGLNLIQKIAQDKTNNLQIAMYTAMQALQKIASPKDMKRILDKEPKIMSLLAQRKDSLVIKYVSDVIADNDQYLQYNQNYL